ncbi:hypothetical protein C1H46_042536 [Malus baccata]|uniref:Uncharacterized protein n=1 Tax=Malus baccata TaxID=106549 RepID=A0A540KCH2_MALBA|nr:hypothetical protein C1H46_042536 [Malus baccata]
MAEPKQPTAPLLGVRSVFLPNFHPSFVETGEEELNFGHIFLEKKIESFNSHYNL